MNIFEQYGIKEVADVTFYKIENNDGNIIETPYLFLDTLKVSTLEQTAEQVTANGGKGNAPIMIWDFGKEINLSLEDALYNPRSMALMWGKQEWLQDNKIVDIGIKYNNNPNKSNYYKFAYASTPTSYTNPIFGKDINNKEIILIKEIPKDLKIVSGKIPTEYLNTTYIESAVIKYFDKSLNELASPNNYPFVPSGAIVTNPWVNLNGSMRDKSSQFDWVIDYVAKEKIAVPIKKERKGIVQESRLIITDKHGYCEDIGFNLPNGDKKVVITSTDYNPGSNIFPQNTEQFGARNFIVYSCNGKIYTLNKFNPNTLYWVTWEQDIYSNFQKLKIKANDFPGVYKIVGETRARNRKTGKDEYFQFIVPRAKLSSNTTLNLEADGDPVVFNLSARVLRPQNGNMIEFVQYQIGDK